MGLVSTWRPGTGQWALDLGIEEPKPKRRERMYVYEDALPDGSWILRTPDFEARDELLRDLGIHGYWSAIHRGLIIRAKHLRDFVAACQAHRWYVRVKPYEAIPA